MPYVTAIDAARLWFKDWGAGPPIVFSHGWPLTSDSFEAQMLFLAERGFRCVAHDRRGHGRSDQTWHGNDMDTYADDLAAVLEQLDLRDAILVGFSTGGGEVARYVGRHGTARLLGVVLVSAVPPLMVKTPDHPGGLPREVFDRMRTEHLAHRSRFYRALASGPFFGFDRPGATVDPALVEWFWLQGMMGGLRNTHDCIRAFSETDFTEDLRRIDVPTLVLHGDEDRIVPIDASARAAVRLIPGAELEVYAGAPHGLIETHKDQLCADLLGFAQAIFAREPQRAAG